MKAWMNFQLLKYSLLCFFFLGSMLLIKAVGQSSVLVLPSAMKGPKTSRPGILAKFRRWLQRLLWLLLGRTFSLQPISIIGLFLSPWIFYISFHIQAPQEPQSWDSLVAKNVVLAVVFSGLEFYLSYCILSPERCQALPKTFSMAKVQ